MYTLENWSVCSPLRDSCVYLPPEVTGIAVQAKSSDRPGFEDGIVTTRIVNVAGRVVTTKSGRQYQLGRPDPDFVTWCQVRGLHDPTNEKEPIKTVK